MKGLVATAFIALTVSSCGTDTTEDDLSRVWSAYINTPGNVEPGQRWAEVKGTMVKEGTVLPSALITSVEGRLPAYLACYDYVSIMIGVGDTKGHLCIYLVENPTRGTAGIMWRGKDFMNDLEAEMKRDGFISK